MQKGEDWQSELMELRVQYGLSANERFFDDFTRLMHNNGIVAILPSFSEQQQASNISRYRMELLEAWRNRNEIRRQSGFRSYEEYSTARVLRPEIYSDFGQVLYVRSSEEIMKIYSMPYFGETDSNSSHDDGLEI